ncbi:MAG: helix-turn-helix domain-containing protein [Prevotellaceae bacterium]|nr:helix-turn-helix domain-containing protein [Prevotellaceae bacterium]
MLTTPHLVNFSCVDPGISQGELAELIGVKQGSLSRIESGRYSVKLDTLMQDCRCFVCKS